MKLKYKGNIQKDKAYVRVGSKRYNDGDEISKEEFDKINHASWEIDEENSEVSSSKKKEKKKYEEGE